MSCVLYSTAEQSSTTCVGHSDIQAFLSFAPCLDDEVSDEDEDEEDEEEDDGGRKSELTVVHD
jgi:hypothetical protein